MVVPVPARLVRGHPAGKSQLLRFELIPDSH
jgi:hypothetical protein